MADAYVSATERGKVVVGAYLGVLQTSLSRILQNYLLLSLLAKDFRMRQRVQKISVSKNLPPLAAFRSGIA
jgi:hypothetical protein